MLKDLLSISMNLDYKHRKKNSVMKQEEKDNLILQLKIIRDSFFGNYVTAEDKQLLFEDICARMPYEVKVTTINPAVEIGIISGISIESKVSVRTKDADIVFECTEVKPYLRSMEDMTNEEYEELKSLCSIYLPSDSRNIGFEDYGVLVFTHHFTNDSYTFKLNNMKVINWLLKKKFDFMGLIDKGLAIRVTEKNNPYEKY